MATRIETAKEGDRSICKACKQGFRKGMKKVILCLFGEYSYHVSCLGAPHGQYNKPNK